MVYSAQASKKATTAKEASIGIRQNIFQGGATQATMKKAAEEIKAARASLKETEQQVFLETIKAYVGILSSQKQIEFLKANVKTKEETLKATKNKFNLGEESGTSRAQAEADYAESLAKLTFAEAEAEGIKATYERLTTKKPGSLAKINLPDGLKNVQVAIDKALLSNPTLLRAQFEETAIRRQIDLVKAGQLPKIDVFADSTRIEKNESTKWQPKPLTLAEQTPKYKSNSTNNRVGLELSWTLYDGGTGRSQNS